MEKEYYILGQMKVKDHKTYISEYGMPFLEILKQFEGELLTATKAAKTLEGDAFGNWTVLMKFPSKKHAYGFITSEEYAPLIQLRVNELTTGGRAVLFPAEVDV